MQLLPDVYKRQILNDGVDFVKLAEAMGATGMRATSQEAFAEELAKALEMKTPVLIDCIGITFLIK